jgi:hypothetical protein
MLFARPEFNHTSKRHTSISLVPTWLQFAVLKITVPLDVDEFTGCVRLGLLV